MSEYNSFRDDALTEGVPFRRICAWLIDVLLLAIIGVALWVLLLGFGLLTFGLAAPMFGLLPLVPFGYHAGFVAGPRAATPGQTLLGLMVCRDDDLGPPLLWQAVLFTLGLYLTLATGLLLLIVVLFTERRRTLHDLLANVVVVRRQVLTGAPEFGNMRWGTPHA